MYLQWVAAYAGPKGMWERQHCALRPAASSARPGMISKRHRAFQYQPPPAWGPQTLEGFLKNLRQGRTEAGWPPMRSSR